MPKIQLEYFELLDTIKLLEAGFKALTKNKLLLYKERLQANVLCIEQVNWQIKCMDLECEKESTKLNLSLDNLKMIQAVAEKERASAPLLIRFIGNRGVAQETQEALRKAVSENLASRAKLDSHERFRKLGPTGFRNLPESLKNDHNRFEFIKNAVDTIKLLEKAVNKVEKLTVEKENKQKEAAILKANRLAITVQKRKSHEENEKAHAAAHREKTRDLADNIKRKLPRNHPCPYCGDSLGSNPHADHIQPVSQGGLSTINNMVYACNKCNGNKTDLTIKQFALKYSLDRNKIEDRLENLGKRI